MQPGAQYHEYSARYPLFPELLILEGKVHPPPGDFVLWGTGFLPLLVSLRLL